MEAFAGIGVALQAVVSLVVGVRLLLLAKRTRCFPEFALGVATAGLPAIGFPLMFGSGVLDDLGVPRGMTLSVHALGGIGVGAAMTMGLVFTWKVFRPRSKVAIGFVVASGLVFFAVPQLATLVLSEHGFVRASEHMGTWQLGIPIFGGIGQAWTAFESLKTYGTMRRRVRIGLAEPLVCNRFVLFAICAITLFLAHVGLIVSMLFAAGPMETTWFVGLIALVGITQATALMLAFMPPRWYAERIEIRAAAVTI